jgi:hypothetical protein
MVTREQQVNASAPPRLAARGLAWAAALGRLEAHTARRQAPAGVRFRKPRRTTQRSNP